MQTVADAPTIGAALRRAAETLRAAGCATPELDARLLVAQATGLDTVGVIANGRERLHDGARLRLDGFLARRCEGESVARILGRREFWGMDFMLCASTLEPRPDSETLVEAALSAIDEGSGRTAPLRIADLGTGTGCLLVSLLHELPNAFGVGVDIAPQAVAMARRNAAVNGVGARARFIVGAWADSLSQGVDVIIANPPYIASSEIEGLAPEVARYDPQAALDGGQDGLDGYRALIPSAHAALSKGGLLILEFGRAQCASLTGLAKVHGFEIKAVRRDLSGTERVLVVQKPLGKNWRTG